VSSASLLHLAAGLAPRAAGGLPKIPTPDIGYRALLPMLIVFGAAAVGVLIEAFVPRAWRTISHTVLALGGLVAALVAVVANTSIRTITAQGAVSVDGPTLFIQGTIIAV
jgi:NADH-quinone oxidoreductase subunit N